MSESWMVVAWRRALLTGITALVALLAISFSAPAEASAVVAYPSQVTSGYQGWAYVRSGPRVCTTPNWCGVMPATAWRWNGSWSRQTISVGTHVYAYPYSGSWHWVWTQRTGWLAIQSASLERRCGIGYATPCR
jgi:hypothetical protein